MVRKFAEIARLVCLFLLLAQGPAEAQSAGFESPSGNITCFVFHPADQEIAYHEDWPLMCLIFEANWQASGGGGCDLDETRAILLPTNGPAMDGWECHGDVFWPISGAIGYGSTWRFHNISCSMERTGVSCTNGRGNGFKLSRAARDLY